MARASLIKIIFHGQLTNFGPWFLHFALMILMHFGGIFEQIADIILDLTLSALNLIDVNVKLRRQLRQCFITFESCQCHFRFEGG